MRTERLRVLLVVGGVLAIVVLGVATLWPQGSQSARDKLAHKALEAAMAVGKNIHLSPAEGSDVNLGSCEYSEEGKTARCTGVRIVYRASDENRTLVVTSERGEAETGNWELDLIGNVTLTSGDAEMKTEQVHYSSTQHLLTSKDPVRLTSPGLEMTGTGLEVQVEKQVVRIRSDVHTRIDRSGVSESAAKGAADSAMPVSAPGAPSLKKQHRPRTGGRS